MFEEPQFAAGLSTRWISANAPPTSDTEHSTNDATAASKLASSAGRAIACPATTRTRTRGPVGASLGHHAQCVVGLDGHEFGDRVGVMAKVQPVAGLRRGANPAKGACFRPACRWCAATR
jgi:hypothetical protein